MFSNFHGDRRRHAAGNSEPLQIKWNISEKNCCMPRPPPAAPSPQFVQRAPGAILLQGRRRGERGRKAGGERIEKIEGEKEARTLVRRHERIRLNHEGGARIVA